MAEEPAGGDGAHHCSGRHSYGTNGFSGFEGVYARGSALRIFGSRGEEKVAGGMVSRKAKVRTDTPIYM